MIVHMSLLRKRRGVSGIISGVFLVAVAVMVFNVLAWQFFQADAYNRLQQERQQREWERYNERLFVFLPEVGVSYLNFTLLNCGAVSAHIVDLFFRFQNGTYQYYKLDVWISPGRNNRIANVGPKLLTSDVYFFQIGTERGNVFSPVPTGSGGISNNPGQGQSMPFIFGFGYNDFQYSLTGPPNPYVWKPAWVVSYQPSLKPYMRVKLNNTYPKDVKVTTGSDLDLYASSNWNRFQFLLQSEVLIKSKTYEWVIFNPPGNALGTGQYYVFILIYYYFPDNPSEVYGTSVSILGAKVA